MQHLYSWATPTPLRALIKGVQCAPEDSCIPRRQQALSTRESPHKQQRGARAFCWDWHLARQTASPRLLLPGRSPSARTGSSAPAWQTHNELRNLPPHRSRSPSRLLPSLAPGPSASQIQRKLRLRASPSHRPSGSGPLFQGSGLLHWRTPGAPLASIEGGATAVTVCADQPHQSFARGHRPLHWLTPTSHLAPAHSPSAWSSGQHVQTTSSRWGRLPTAFALLWTSPSGVAVASSSPKHHSLLRCSVLNLGGTAPACRR